MGICATRYIATGGHSLIVYRSDGTHVYGPTQLSIGANLAGMNCTDPINEKSWVFEGSSGDKHAHLINLSDGSADTTIDYSSETDLDVGGGVPYIQPQLLTDGGYFIATPQQAAVADGYIYAIKTDFSRIYPFNLNIGARVGRVRLTFDKQYLIVATGEKVYKLPITSLTDFASSVAFESACDWVSTLTGEAIQSLELHHGGDDILVTSYATWDTDVNTTRIVFSSGAQDWQVSRGFRGGVPNWTTNKAYVANGAALSPGVTYGVELSGVDGSLTGQVASKPTAAGRVAGAVWSHDDDVVFFGGYSGTNYGTLWGANTDPTFARAFYHNSGAENPTVYLFGDPSGYYLYQYQQGGAQEPNWADPANPVTPGTGGAGRYNTLHRYVRRAALKKKLGR